MQTEIINNEMRAIHQAADEEMKEFKDEQAERTRQEARD